MKNTHVCLIESNIPGTFSEHLLNVCWLFIIGVAWRSTNWTQRLSTDSEIEIHQRAFSISETWQTRVSRLCDGSLGSNISLDVSFLIQLTRNYNWRAWWLDLVLWHLLDHFGKYLGNIDARIYYLRHVISALLLSTSRFLRNVPG